MSYCVNCGVELDKTAVKCPLCNTIVINPNCPPDTVSLPPYPPEKGSVEPVNRRALAIFVSVVLVAISLACLVLNLVLFGDDFWSAYIMGACLVLWVFTVPVMLHKPHAMITITIDGAVIAIFCYIIALQFDDRTWYYETALPIIVFITLLVMIFAHTMRRFKLSALAVLALAFGEVGALCVFIELAVRHMAEGRFYIRWSAVVLTCCLVVITALITVLKQTRLYEEVKRRLHF